MRPGTPRPSLPPIARVEDTLKPHGLTFAAYEALRLLAFTRTGSLHICQLGERLMVHPASVTNAFSKLERRGLVKRSLSAGDRRVIRAAITPEGSAMAEEATCALNQAPFGMPRLSQGRSDHQYAVPYPRRGADGVEVTPA